MSEPARRPHPLMVELASSRYHQRRSQLEVASQIGVSQIAVCYWENGRRTPNLDRFAALADELGYQITLTPKESRG